MDTSDPTGSLLIAALVADGSRTAKPIAGRSMTIERKVVTVDVRVRDRHEHGDCESLRPTRRARRMPIYCGGGYAPTDVRR